MTDLERELPPSLSERYSVEEVLGRGTYGIVLRARRRADGLPVAVKMLLDDTPGPEQVRFLREATLLARVLHKRVVGIIEVCEAKGRPVIVTELLEGGTLRGLIHDESPLSIDRALELVLELFDGLSAVHALGVIHRDVKPENLFLTADGHLKLGDLGLARDPEAPRLTQTAHVVGSPRYMAPEQVRGERITPAADVFGAGLILHEMLSGESVFVKLRTEKTIFVRYPDPIPSVTMFRSDVPAPLSAALVSILHVDPARRPADAAAARALLAPEPDPGPTRRAARRPRVPREPAPVPHTSSHPSASFSGPRAHPNSWPLFVLPVAGMLALGTLFVPRRPAPPPPAPTVEVASVAPSAPPSETQTLAHRAAAMRAQALADLCRGDLPKAESLLKRAIALGQAESLSRLQLAYVLFVANRGRDMLAQRSLVQRVDPAAYAAWRRAEDAVGRAQIAILSGRYAEAIPEFAPADRDAAWYPAIPFFRALAQLGVDGKLAAVAEVARTRGAMPESDAIISMMVDRLEAAHSKAAADALRALVRTPAR